MLTEDYTVRLETFEGPLDLLLHLILRAELDVTEISIARITDQYLAYLEHLSVVDVEKAGEFLVLAATMLEIKSRYVTPRTPGDGGGEAPGDAADREAALSGDDLASDLVRQLLQYKSYRDAGDALEARRDEWLRRYPAARASSDRQALADAIREVEDADIEDLEVYDLVEAFSRILSTVVFDRLGDHQVSDDETPIELHAADIIDRLENNTDAAPDSRGMRLRAIFEGRSRAEMVGLFIALLELVRQHRIRIHQDADRAEQPNAEPGDDIVINLRPPGDDEIADAEHVREAPIDEVIEEVAAENLDAAEAARNWDDDHIFGDEDEPDEDDDDLRPV